MQTYSHSPSEAANNGRLIGKGRTAEVRLLAESTVIKIFETWVPREAVDREFKATRALQSAGIPLPAAYEQLTLSDGRNAIIFEYAHGPSMLEAVQARPWTLFAAARQLAELHASIHRCVAPTELPTQRDQLLRWLDQAKGYPAADRADAIACINELPGPTHVCHGDHPGNILITRNGPIIIDWSGATRADSRSRTSAEHPSSSNPLTCRRSRPSICMDSSRPRANSFIALFSTPINGSKASLANKSRDGSQPNALPSPPGGPIAALEPDDSTALIQNTRIPLSAPSLTDPSLKKRKTLGAKLLPGLTSR